MHIWQLLQLADGTFPNGGFAHSGGLEASSVLAREMALDDFLDASLVQAGRSALPFVRAAAERSIDVVDEAFDATLCMAAPNAASRAQGRVLAGACGRVWDEVAEIAAYARRGPAHHCVVFGAIAARLGVPAEEAYLHGTARTILSAAVRLGLVGPIEAQRMLATRASALERIVREGTTHEAAAQTAPLIEIYAALHARLDGRMFQS